MRWMWIAYGFQSRRCVASERHCIIVMFAAQKTPPHTWAAIVLFCEYRGPLPKALAPCQYPHGACRSAPTGSKDRFLVLCTSFTTFRGASLRRTSRACVAHRRPWPRGLAAWELRIGKLRVIYEVIPGEPGVVRACWRLYLVGSIRRVAMCVIKCPRCHGFQERSIPHLFFQPRTERTASCPRGPGRSLGEILASAIGTCAEFRVSTEGAAQNQSTDWRESRKILGGMAWAYWR